MQGVAFTVPAMHKMPLISCSWLRLSLSGLASAKVRGAWREGSVGGCVRTSGNE
jgi:hypothetical protein